GGDRPVDGHFAEHGLPSLSAGNCRPARKVGWKMSANEVPAANEFPKLTAFEVSLASLALQPAALDRESLFFQAGREAALREAGSQRSWLCRWGWPTGFSV